MRKKAVIFDLDNTIYPVRSIGNELFANLFELITQTGDHDGNLVAIKADIMRKPFQVVAADHRFGKQLTEQGFDLLKNISYEGPIEPFNDYKQTRNLPVEKYLVTTGFLKLQQSKIRRMGLEKDFKEIHIIDPATSTNTKKEVFAAIIKRNGHQHTEVLVIGDDPHSEIKAAMELGIDAVLFDKLDLHPGYTGHPRITSYSELESFLF